MVTPLTDLSTRVSEELLNDSRTKNYSRNIDVAADRGVITLTGNVPTESVREAAEEIARNAPGVITVHNELKIVGK